MIDRYQKVLFLCLIPAPTRNLVFRICTQLVYHGKNHFHLTQLSNCGDNDG